MIRLIGIKDYNASYEITQIPDDSVYNLTSSYMSDDLNPRPYRISGQAIMWLLDEGLFGEIECIGAPITYSPQCSVHAKLMVEHGYPQLEMTSPNSEVSVERRSDDLTIWLTKDKVIDRILRSGSVEFLVSSDQLVGIKYLRLL